MSDAAVKTTKELARATADLSEAKEKGKNQYPAVDALLMLALERRSLEIPEFTCFGSALLGKSKLRS